MAHAIEDSGPRGRVTEKDFVTLSNVHWIKYALKLRAQGSLTLRSIWPRASRYSKIKLGSDLEPCLT